MAAIPLKHDDIYYPESDGQPMAETDVHRRVTIDLLNCLERYYLDAPDVYVSGDLMMYDIPGNPKSSFSPDVFVVKGVPKGDRRVYKIWEEGRVPCFVIEVTSDSTRREDLVVKKDRYQRLSIDEYFLFDPLGDYLRPRLQGYRLEEGRYQPIEPAPDGSLSSEITGLTLRGEGQKLRLTETATREKLLWSEEQDERVRKAEERAVREAEARRATEEELARLRREVERLGGDPPKSV